MKEKQTFEEALQELETIVEQLEAGTVSLDEAITQYEKGIALSKMCYKRLQDAEKKIEVLRKKADGSFETEPFDEDELTEDEKPKKTKRTKRDSAQEEGLFS